MRTYNDIVVDLVRATSDPVGIVSDAMSMTMKDFKVGDKNRFAKAIGSVLDMGHTSVFEHVQYSFTILGASRSFLAQVTRHRVGSFTSGSQHYQKYSGYEPVVSNAKFAERTKAFFEEAVFLYDGMLAEGWSREEARQVLPNAMANNLLWSVNARSLINFFSLRLCYRNVLEMRVVAEQMHNLVVGHFPELFAFVGPQCFNGACRQGKMACGRRRWEKGVL
jgi:thymidylate synthase (FAD)